MKSDVVNYLRILRRFRTPLFAILLTIACESEHDGSQRETQVVNVIGTQIIIPEIQAEEFWNLEIKYMYNTDEAKASTVTFWTPTNSEVDEVETKIWKHIKHELKHNSNNNDFYNSQLKYILDNDESYKRQYVGIEINGEKQIWCNYLSSEMENVELQSPVIVEDGGAGFWRVIYNRGTYSCTKLTINGVA